MIFSKRPYSLLQEDGNPGYYVIVAPLRQLLGKPHFAVQSTTA